MKKVDLKVVKIEKMEWNTDHNYIVHGDELVIVLSKINEIIDWINKHEKAI